MDMLSRMLAPWMSVRMPAGGDVVMNYHPNTNWGGNQEVGDPVIEDAIFSRVASPGRQIGRILEAVNVLVSLVERGDLTLQGEAIPGGRIQEFEDLKELAAKVSATKQPLQRAVSDQAERAMEKLKSEDREAFDALIEKFLGDDAE